MTKVCTITLLESCLDSSTVKEFELDGPVTEILMRAVAVNGSLKYYPHFPRPYFRIERAFGYVIQGVLGNRTLRVTFSPAADENIEKELCEAIEK